MSAEHPAAEVKRGWKPPQVSMPVDGAPVRGLEDGTAPVDAGLSIPTRAIPKKELPRRIIKQGEMLMAYNMYNNSSFTKGVNRLNLNGQADYLWSDKYSNQGYRMSVGYKRDNRLCFFTIFQIFSIDDYRYLEVDPYTGEVFEDYSVPLFDDVTGFDNYLPLFISLAYNEDENTLWGYTSNEGGSGYAFCKASCDDPSHPEAIVEKEVYENVCASLCYNSKDKCLYGVNRANNFVRVNTDGTQTVIMPLGVTTKWSRAGMLYVPEEDYYIWNCQLTDGSTGIWCIDPANNQVSTLINYQSEAAFPVLFFGETSKDPRGLSTPIIDIVDFGAGQNDGTISFFLPSTRFDGTSISGTLEWTAYLDDEPYATGQAPVGSKVTVKYEGIETGSHYFSFEADNGVIKTPWADKKIFIGYDQPLKPANVRLNETEISWNAVTRGVNAGYLDIDRLVYHVYINGEKIGETSDNSFPLPESLADLNYAGYVAKVVADNSGVLSEESDNSNMITVGRPWPIDFHITPTRVEGQAFSAIDVNKDSNVWGYGEIEGVGYLHEPVAGNNGSNDWLFSPPLDFSDLTTDYEIALDVANVSEFYRNHSVEVWLCSELNPTATVTKLIEYQAQEKDLDYNRISQVFAIPEGGTYYIAFHVQSGPFERGYRVKEIDITKTGESRPRPAEVENIFCQGGPEGALYADVEFDMPKTFISGDPIPADEEIEVEVAGASTASIKGKPGEFVTVRIDAVQGDNPVSVTPSYKGYSGHRSSVNVYCGYDIPGPVENISAYVAEDNLRLHLSWEPPTTVGDNGYYVDPAQCTYRVYQNTENGWTVIADLDSDAREYVISVAPDNGLRSEWVGVVPVNVAGESPTMHWMSDMLGTPYDLPVHETFPDASLTYAPLRILRIADELGATSWSFNNPKFIHESCANESGICLVGTTEVAETMGIIMLPKVSTKGLKEAMLRINVWTGMGMPYIGILGETWDSNGMMDLGNVYVGEGWADFCFDLPEQMLDREWVALYIAAYYPTTNYFAMISNYSVTAETSGVKGIVAGEASSGRVTGLRGTIAVDGYDGQPVTVSTLDGSLTRVVESAPASLTINVGKGIYIVNAGGEAHKVIVR